MANIRPVLGNRDLNNFIRLDFEETLELAGRVKTRDFFVGLLVLRSEITERERLNEKQRGVVFAFSFVIAFYRELCV